MKLHIRCVVRVWRSSAGRMGNAFILISWSRSCFVETIRQVCEKDVSVYIRQASGTEHRCIRIVCLLDVWASFFIYSYWFRYVLFALTIRQRLVFRSVLLSWSPVRIVSPSGGLRVKAAKGCEQPCAFFLISPIHNSVRNLGPTTNCGNFIMMIRTCGLTKMGDF